MCSQPSGEGSIRNLHHGHKDLVTPPSALPSFGPSVLVRLETSLLGLSRLGNPAPANSRKHGRRLRVVRLVPSDPTGGQDRWWLFSSDLFSMLYWPRVALQIFRFERYSFGIPHLQ